MNIQETRLARAFMVGINSRRHETGVSEVRRHLVTIERTRKIEMVC